MLNFAKNFERIKIALFFYYFKILICVYMQNFKYLKVLCIKTKNIQHKIKT